MDKFTKIILILAILVLLLAGMGMIILNKDNWNSPIQDGEFLDSGELFDSGEWTNISGNSKQGSLILPKDEEKIEDKYIKLEDLAQDYSLEKAIQDKCFVNSYIALYNLEELEQFLSSIKETKATMLRIAQTTIEGDLILQDLKYLDNGDLIIRVDSTRDKYMAAEDRIISEKTLKAGSYQISKREEENTFGKISVNIYIEELKSGDEMQSKPINEAEQYLVCSYSKEKEVQKYFE